MKLNLTVAYAFLLTDEGKHSTVKFDVQAPNMGLYFANMKARKA
jgi:hypothetical protein